MKKDKNLKDLKKKTKKLIDYKWIIQIFFISFIISILFSFTSEMVIPNVNIFIGTLILIVFIVIGIAFDMIGVAVTSSDEAPFHAMASRKVRGAKIAVKMKKNADKVSSFCNDVIGDICGIVSGSAGSIVSLGLAQHLNLNSFFTSLIVTALIASFTIGGKAMGKSIAINKSNYILYEFSKILAFFHK